MVAISPQVAEISVVYHPAKNIKDAPIIRTSKDAAFYFMEAFNRDTMALQEQFLVMYLNRANKVLGIFKASSGGITGTVADPRLILGTALKVAAVSMVLAHNHPSGNLKPSRADEELTRKIKEAANYIDMNVIDHLIVDPYGGFLSFAEEGML